MLVVASSLLLVLPVTFDVRIIWSLMCASFGLWQMLGYKHVPFCSISMCGATLGLVQDSTTNVAQTTIFLDQSQMMGCAFLQI